MRPNLTSPPCSSLTAERSSPTERIPPCSRRLATAGAEILEEARVRSIEPERTSVRVTTARDEIVAGAVVVAAGAWSPGLLGPVGIELPVVPTRETVTYFELDDALALPSVIDDAVPDARAHGLRRPGLVSYALAAPGVGLKAGLHHAGPPADPDEPGEPDAAVARWVASWVERRYPAADGAPIRSETCLYTNTADESFVLERHGRVRRGVSVLAVTGSSSRPPSGARSLPSHATLPAESLPAPGQ